MKCVNKAEKKRAELDLAIAQGKVQDPISILVAVGIAVGSALLSRALAPKAPTQQVGLMKGTIQVQNSQQGIFVPEIYGAAPVVSLVPGSASNWISGVNLSFGANGRAFKNAGADQVWNAGAVHGTIVAADQDAFIRFVVDDSPATFSAAAIGFSTDDSPESGAGVGGVPNLEAGVVVGINHMGFDQFNQPILSYGFRGVYNGIGGPGLGTWSPGGEFRLEKRNNVYRLYYGPAEIANFSPPEPSGPVYISVSGWRTGYGIVSSFVQVGGDIGTPPSEGSGGCKVPAQIVWAVSPQKHSQVVQQPTQGGGKGHQSTPVEQVYYTISFRANFARGNGGLQLVREYANTDILLNQDPNLSLPTGVYNPTGGEPPVYPPIRPPDPIPVDTIPTKHGDGELLVDGAGVETGAIQLGASQLAVYPGNMTQDIDPTEEADVDATHGLGSTPAHRGISGIVHTDLNLQRWQNIIPNITAVWQHATLKTLDVIFAYLCTRITDPEGVPLLDPSEYDFSALSAVKCRGLLIDGRRFAPSEIIDNPEMQDVYNYFTTEGDGKILAYVNGSEPTVTIPESKIGWIDATDSMPQVFARITHTKPEATKKPRKVDLRYNDPGTDWEVNTQSSQRRVTLGNTEQQLSVTVTLNPDEARVTTDRRIFREHVGEPIRFTLSWEYLYLYAGYKIIVPTSYGITYTLRLKSIVGGIGVRDCEGVLLEIASFAQPMLDTGHRTFNPAQPTPAITIVAALDLPAWRPADVGTFGLYFAGTPRETDIQTWIGWMLFLKRGGDFDRLSTITGAAIMGRVAGISGTLSSNPNATDNTSVITVDLYGSKASLESVPEADMIAGLNRAAVGLIIIGFATAVRVAGYPNRWNVSVLRNGLNSTYDLIASEDNVTWADVVGVTVTGNSLSKPGADGWNAGARSTQSVIAGDCYVEFIATETNKFRMCGLSNGNTDQNYTDIDFALYPDATGTLHVYEGGVSKGSFGAYTAGDALRVGVEGGAVKYRRNGTLIYTSLTAPTYPLLVDTSLYSNGATITNVRLYSLSEKSFVVLNDAVQFVPLNAGSELNTVLKIKGPSLGQSLSDTAELETSCSGNSGRGTAPLTFTGYFDPSSDGSLLLDWLLGLESFAAGAEEYELEIRSAAGAGATTIRGPIPISPLQLARTTVHPPLQNSPSPLAFGGCFKDNPAYTNITWGDLSSASIDVDQIQLGTGFEIISKAEIDPAGGFMVETEVTGSYFPYRFGIAPYTTSLQTNPWFWWKSAGSIQDNYPDTMLLTPDDINSIRAIPGERLSIVVSPDGTVSYYVNYLGASSQPFSVSPTKIDFTKKYRIFFLECDRQPPTGSGFKRFGFQKTRWLRQTPEFVYNGDMQRQDNSGALPGTVYARLRQKSLYSWGQPSPWVYGTFVR